MPANEGGAGGGRHLNGPAPVRAREQAKIDTHFARDDARLDAIGSALKSLCEKRGVVVPRAIRPDAQVRRDAVSQPAVYGHDQPRHQPLAPIHAQRRKRPASGARVCPPYLR